MTFSRDNKEQLFRLAIGIPIVVASAYFFTVLREWQMFFAFSLVMALNLVAHCFYEPTSRLSWSVTGLAGPLSLLGIFVLSTTSPCMTEGLPMAVAMSATYFMVALLASLLPVFGMYTVKTWQNGRPRPAAVPVIVTDENPRPVRKPTGIQIPQLVNGLLAPA